MKKNEQKKKLTCKRPLIVVERVILSCGVCLDEAKNPGVARAVTSAPRLDPRNRALLSKNFEQIENLQKIGFKEKQYSYRN